MARKHPRFLYLRGRLEVRKGRKRVFVKLYDTCIPSKRRGLQRRLARERTCLEVLEAFAVPSLVSLSPATLESELGFVPWAHVAQEFIAGERFSRSSLTPSEALGAWLFLAEHLVAFRRHQILYTDIKPSNVLVCRNPLRVVQIDFDFATVANEQGVYPSDAFGYTAGYQAPEHGQGPSIRESALVFQLGMLLGKALIRVGNSPHELRRTRGKLRAQVAKLGSPAMGKLAADCLAVSPDGRPRDYEQVLERAKKGLPARGTRRKAVSVWKALRAPYVDQLAEVGLTL